MKAMKYAAATLLCLIFAACQDKSIDIADPVIKPIDASLINGSLQGNDYVWTWTAQQGLQMQVSVCEGTAIRSIETVSGNSFTHSNIETNIEFSYVFKLTDGENLSLGVTKKYMREGASPVSGIAMAQLDKTGGYDAVVTWTASPDADNVLFKATNGRKNIDETLPNNVMSYTIQDVQDGDEWQVEVTAKNAKGLSLPVSSSLRIGKTTIGFLSEYPTVEKLMAEGDDDEICAWLWLHSEYDSARYIYFGDIASTADLTPFRVLFWIRDVEDGRNGDDLFNMPAVVDAATPYIREWYRDGGSLLLWSHATPYIGTLGRLDTEMLRTNDRTIATGPGGWNGDVWKMAVVLHPGSRFKKDASSHPMFRGIDYETTDRTKLIPVKGAGWTEDHNCLYFNIPSVLTGIGNQEEACYNTIVNEYGIIPLATWDSQIDWVSQLNVWEAQQGNTDFKGTIICVGNGGCEFSLRNADGSPDLSSMPKNNPYQGNILAMAKNALEYLKTR